MFPDGAHYTRRQGTAILPFTAPAPRLGFGAPPAAFFLALAGTLLVKQWFFRHFAAAHR